MAALIMAPIIVKEGVAGLCESEAVIKLLRSCIFAVCASVSRESRAQDLLSWAAASAAPCELSVDNDGRHAADAMLLGS